jgi:hypothetical protein
MIINIETNTPARVHFIIFQTDFKTGWREIVRALFVEIALQ